MQITGFHGRQPTTPRRRTLTLRSALRSGHTRRSPRDVAPFHVNGAWASFGRCGTDREERFSSLPGYRSRLPGRTGGGMRLPHSSRRCAETGKASRGDGLLSIVQLIDKVFEPGGSGHEDIRHQKRDDRHHKEGKIKNDEADGDEPDGSFGDGDYRSNWRKRERHGLPGTLRGRRRPALGRTPRTVLVPDTQEPPSVAVQLRNCFDFRRWCL